MNSLQDCRAHEAQCRSRALSDEEHRDLWLSMADRWSYLAHKEAAFDVGERTGVLHGGNPDPKAAS
jgi:hypothetical protein